MIRVFITAPWWLRVPLATSQGPEQRKMRGARLSGAGFLGSCDPRALLGPQEHQDGEHAPRLAARRRQRELLEDARDVLLDDADRDHELLGDALVRAAGCHQLQ